MSKKSRHIVRQAPRGYTRGMAPADEEAPAGLRRSDIARILSPMLLFFAHVIYLAIWSADSFFNKWIDGSFSFFVALVLCNIIRARVVGAAGRQRDGRP